MKNLKDKKGFTIIELIVVVAILGILVLLAGPRLLGYVEKAELARIQHDVKVMEQEVGTMLMNNDDEFNKWENNSKDLNQLIQEGKLFEKEGVAKKIESINKTYKVIPEKYKDNINTKLKGTFYANSGGKVYYEHDKPLFGQPGDSNDDGTNPEQPGDNNDEGDNPEQPGDNNDDVNNKKGLMNPIEPRDPKNGEIPINSADELAKIGDPKYLSDYPLDRDYILTSNIDLSGYSEGEGWTPIGNYSSNFTGSFDGNGYKITGLTIDRSGTNYIGLFGYTDKATIRNVALEDVNIKGKDSTGGLVGYAYISTITNSYATGEVTGEGSSTGGLVGGAWHSTITNSYATGEVTGEGSPTGGLVGYASGSTKITNSYATGSVTGNSSTGGLVGLAWDSTITNSYATGSVTGGERTGGLVGWAWDSTITNSYATGEVTGEGNDTGGLVGYAYSSTEITNSYATGKVTGTSNTGGLVGKAISSTITNSYWNTETTGQDKSAGGSGKSTDEMKDKKTYTNWDFENTWEINEGQPYPTLRQP